MQDTLQFIGVHEKPMIMVFNKIDALEDLDLVHTLTSEYAPSVSISAQRGINLTTLRETMLQMNDERHETVHLLVPYNAMGMVSHVYRIGTVLSREDRDDGVELTARVEVHDAASLQAWAIVAKPAKTVKAKKKVTV